MGIWITNRQKKIRLSKTKLEQWTRKILKLAGWDRGELSVVLADDPEIARYHRRFLGEEGATDVLAFEPGDLVISVETAKKAAPRFGNRWDEELLLYLCHGILHLQGYRDSTLREKARMDKKQTLILQKALGSRWRSKKRKPLF